MVLCACQKLLSTERRAELRELLQIHAQRDSLRILTLIQNDVPFDLDADGMKKVRIDTEDDVNRLKNGE